MNAPTATGSATHQIASRGESAIHLRLYAKPYCFTSAGGFASGSSAGAVPRSSTAGAQSPAQSLVPLMVPTSLHPFWAAGLSCFGVFPAFGAPVCAKADPDHQMIRAMVTIVLIVIVS